MTATQHPAAVPFTTDDYAARMARVMADAGDAGLDGLLVTPGPDLVWLTGYQPTAITERLTMLFLTSDREPTLLVPTLERPDAEAAEGAPAIEHGRLARRRRPLRRRERRSCDRTGPTASPTTPGRCTCSDCSRRCPGRATAR